MLDCPFRVIIQVMYWERISTHEVKLIHFGKLINFLSDILLKTKRERLQAGLVFCKFSLESLLGIGPPGFSVLTVQTARKKWPKSDCFRQSEQHKSDYFQMWLWSLSYTVLDLRCFAMRPQSDFMPLKCDRCRSSVLEEAGPGKSELWTHPGFFPFQLLTLLN